MKIVLGTIALFGLGCLAQAQTEKFAGRMLDKVVCESDAAQSYSLYVPSTYAKEKKWPVIFCFDASARGWLPVERLRGAAEKYGYLVAGSLTSRNGPVAANNAAIKAMIRDVSLHFSVDASRVYTTGVSGGARVATAIALSGVAKGVIGCAAGFPELPEGVPQKVPFVFFGTTGTEDFNWRELLRLDRDLEERNATHRIVVFSGGHEWASATLMTEAVEWLELQAMRAGTRPMDRDFVEAQWRARLAAVPMEPGLERWRAMKSLVADFTGLADVAEYGRIAKELGASKEIKASLRAEAAIMAREAELEEQLVDAAGLSAARKQKLAAELKAKDGAAEDSAERRMVRRAISSYLSMVRPTVRQLFEEKNHAKAADMLELAAALRSGQKSTLFDLARARAMRGDKKGAFDALDEAIAAGFNETERLESDPAFAKFRRDERYHAAVTKLQTDASVPPEVLPAMRISASLANVELRLYYLPTTGGGSPRLALLGVETVLPTSLAAQAGLKKGMEVVAIQGIRIRGLTERELDKVMALPVAKEIILTVRDSPAADEQQLHIPIVRPPAVKVNSVETLVRADEVRRKFIYSPSISIIFRRYSAISG